MISTVKEIHDKETDERRQKMLEAYIELLRKTALGVGISRRFFIILEFQKTIGNDGTDFDMVCADLNSVAARVKAIWNRLETSFYPPAKRTTVCTRRFIRFFADTRAKRCHFRSISRKS